MQRQTDTVFGERIKKGFTLAELLIVVAIINVFID
ncbi:prepilin-type N-terminal cleavage/methylation domain-containing protein [Oribacterium sp. NK2B42]